MELSQTGPDPSSTFLVKFEHCLSYLSDPSDFMLVYRCLVESFSTHGMRTIVLLGASRCMTSLRIRGWEYPSLGSHHVCLFCVVKLVKLFFFIVFIGFGCIGCRVLDEQSRLEAQTPYMYSFSQHALPVTDIACFLGAIAISSSEDRTCKVCVQLNSCSFLN